MWSPLLRLYWYVLFLNHYFFYLKYCTMFRIMQYGILFYLHTFLVESIFNTVPKVDRIWLLLSCTLLASASRKGCRRSFAVGISLWGGGAWNVWPNTERIPPGAATVIRSVVYRSLRWPHPDHSVPFCPVPEKAHNIPVHACKWVTINILMLIWVNAFKFV